MATNKYFNLKKCKKNKNTQKFLGIFVTFLLPNLKLLILIIVKLIKKVISFGVG